MKKLKFKFKNFNYTYYDKVCDFLVEISQYNREHINWNWARWEWMFFHPEFNRSQPRPTRSAGSSFSSIMTALARMFSTSAMRP